MTDQLVASTPSRFAVGAAVRILDREPRYFALVGTVAGFDEARASGTRRVAVDLPPIGDRSRRAWFDPADLAPVRNEVQ